MSVVLSESSIFIGSKSKAISHLQTSHPGFKIVSVDNVESQIKNYSKFFDNDKIFLVINPTNEEVKTIGLLNNNQYHLFFDDESFDGRNSFISKIKKNNRLFEYSFPLFGDIQNLKSQLSKACKDNKIHPDPACYDWIIHNCPTTRIKSKSEGSKKEKIVYDIELIMQELLKLNSVFDVITLEDIQDSVFKTDADIFDFVESMMAGDFMQSIKKSEKLIDSMGEQGVLMVFLSQILFMLSVAGCKEKNIYNPDLVVSLTEFRDLMNKNLSDTWNELQASIKTQNPIRVKIELSKNRPSVDILSQVFLITVDTIKDLRSFGSIPNSMFFFVQKVTCITSNNVRR